MGIALYMPYQAVIIPLTTITAKSGLINSHLGLILCYLIINVPLASVLMGTFFLGIPRELEEAAEVDGASKIQIFFEIVVPISLPAYASVAIIIFTQVWNEFFIALTLSTPKTQTVQVAMAMTQGQHDLPVQPADGGFAADGCCSAADLPVPGKIFHPRHSGRRVERLIPIAPVESELTPLC